MKLYKIIGLMSGTSLDGLDICHAHITFEQQKGWTYKILNAETVQYSTKMFELLKHAITLDTIPHAKLSVDFAKFSAQSVNDFITKYKMDKIDIDCIASHGHTTHHRPELGFTLQIGCGQTIAAETQLMVISDFRTKDVVYGGQGAPLVPIGDELLFDANIDGFLNIGGISNISFKKSNQRLAFDVCPGNLPLNFLSEKLGVPFDNNGDMARVGKIDLNLLNQLNALPFYEQQGKVSLGLEWIKSEIYPLVDEVSDVNIALATCVEHIALKVSKVCNDQAIKQLLITGGGALNSFLVERIQKLTKTKIIVPDKETILFKEALIFAFLGALNLENLPNCMPLVTKARRAVVGGVRYYP